MNDEKPDMARCLITTPHVHGANGDVWRAFTSKHICSGWVRKTNGDEYAECVGEE